MREAYAGHAMLMRRHYPAIHEYPYYIDAVSMTMNEVKAEIVDRFPTVLDVDFEWDVVANYSKLMINAWWALQNRKKFLLRSEIFAFPVLHPVMGKGPYIPEVQAHFCSLDAHALVYAGGSLWQVHEGFERSREATEVYLHNVRRG